MWRVVALAALLLPGCFFFSEYDAGCPGELTVTNVSVLQDLDGPWVPADVARALDEVGEVAYYDQANETFHAFVGKANDTESFARLLATEDGAQAHWGTHVPRCIEEARVEDATAEERARHGDAWSHWLAAILAGTQLTQRGEPQWSLTCQEPEHFEAVACADLAGIPTAAPGTSSGASTASSVNGASSRIP